jgi:hypothetical protein
LRHVRPMPCAPQSRVYRKIPAANRLVDDRPYLLCPGIRRIDSALIAHLCRQAHSNGPVP